MSEKYYLYDNDENSCEEFETATRLELHLIDLMKDCSWDEGELRQGVRIIKGVEIQFTVINDVKLDDVKRLTRVNPSKL